MYFLLLFDWGFNGGNMGHLKIEHIISWPDLFHLTHNNEHLLSEGYLGHEYETLLAQFCHFISCATLCSDTKRKCDIYMPAIHCSFCIQVIGFIVSMLQRACVSLERGTDSPVESQTLSMGMGLVAILLSGAAEVVCYYTFCCCPLLYCDNFPSKKLFAEFLERLHLAV